MEVKGKTAIVTGGAHRVGAAITLALAQAGANVVINYLSSEVPAQATALKARELGVEALPFRADVADLVQVQSMVAAVRERFGAVGILVNAASPFVKTPVPTQDYSGWHRVISALIDGSFYCANLVAPMMQDQGEGCIVNIVDLAAWMPWPDFTAHAVGKAGLMALTRQLAFELAPTIRVNAVAPGPVLPPDYFDEALIERAARRTLLKRWGTPNDVAQAVLFLISADYVTGEVLVVDGGESIGQRKTERQ